MRIKDFDPDSPSESVAFERQPMRNEWQLESWLHQNPDLLLDESVLIIGRQHTVSTGTPDILALDKFANVVVFEFKAGKSGTNSATEQSILGQPQSYASAIESMDYDELSAVYEQYCDEIADGKWDGIETPSPTKSLDNSLEEWFDRSVARKHFNTYQRMVIVAEKITSTTESNARHLVQQGLQMQCVEVEFHLHPNDDSRAVLAAETIVDYDLQKVKPDHESTAEFESLLVNLRDRIKPKLEAKTGPVPLDYVTGTPRAELKFSSNSLFENLRLGYLISPESDGSVQLKLFLLHWGERDSNREKELVRTIIRENTDILDDETLSFDPGSSYVVKKRLPLRTEQGEMTEESMAEIEDEFLTLIERIHPVVVEEVKRRE